MGVFVKICGICSEGDLEQISAFKPDAVGFIQWPRSKRYVAPETVGQWDTIGGIKRVGVFVDPSESELVHAVESARFDVVQVHRISNDWTVKRSVFQDMEFWRALNPDEFESVGTGFVFDRCLVDSYDPETIGGTGQTCDWNQARELIDAMETPILLAGGLTPDNVAAAIETVVPWGVDVSSGVEIEPGKKDIRKVKAFIAACRAL